MLGRLDRPLPPEAGLAATIEHLVATAGLQVDPETIGDRAPGCPALELARTGVLWLTGPSDGPPVPVDLPLGDHLRVLAAGIATLSAGFGHEVELEPAQLVAERAAARAFHRRGSVSANGSCRLVRCADDWAAWNLPRHSDLDLLPAVLGTPVSGEPWDAVEAVCAGHPAEELVGRAQQVGIAAAVVGGSAGCGPPVTLVPLGDPTSGRDHRPRVVDFSAMWAGPLCAHILGRAGASVCTVEDPDRPDGARFGDPALYTRLHEGHALARISFGSAEGRARLHRLVKRADIVIESSRPRALHHLGLDPDAFLSARPGRSWISITGYGRRAYGDRVAFGDDAAAAGGLVAWSDEQSPVFVGDAIADPISGLVAALGGLASQAVGGGHLVEVSMSAASAAATVGRRCQGPHVVEADGRGGWVVRYEGRTERLRTPAEVIAETDA